MVAIKGFILIVCNRRCAKSLKASGTVPVVTHGQRLPWTKNPHVPKMLMKNHPKKTVQRYVVPPSLFYPVMCIPDHVENWQTILMESLVSRPSGTH